MDLDCPETWATVETMLLHSFERARDFATLDPMTGRIEFFSRDGEDREKLQARINGFFSDVDGSLIALYRYDGMLTLRIDHKDYVIDDTISSHLDKVHGPSKLLRYSRRRNTFHLLQNGEIIVSFSYQAPVSPNKTFDFTFTGDEDFDFMLFIHNVLSDSERRSRVWM